MMLHDWNTVWSDNAGALYQCRRCKVSHEVMFMGMDIHSFGSLPSDVCRPMDVLKAQLETEQDAITRIVEGGAH